MELLNTVVKFSDDSSIGHNIKQEVYDNMVLMLSPIIPHLSHQLWKELGHEDIILDAVWPQLDETALVQDSIEMVIQVNGKLRAKIQISADADKVSCESMAVGNEQVKKFIGDQPIRKVIVVPKKLVNIVI
jgi:leucyl-tRNA synthetase